MPSFDSEHGRKGVPRSTPIGTERGTFGHFAERDAERQAERGGGDSLKTLAMQALERIEGRNGGRNAERNESVPGRSALTRERNAFADASEQPDWRAYFEERAGIREHNGGSSWADAEAAALADCVARWRALHPQQAAGDGACAQCGGPGPDTPVLAAGGHAWLHRRCWPAMDAESEREALLAVASLLGQASGKARPEER